MGNNMTPCVCAIMQLWKSKDGNSFSIFKDLTFDATKLRFMKIISSKKLGILTEILSKYKTPAKFRTQILSQNITII